MPPGIARAQSTPWVLKKDKDGIRVYTRSENGSKFNEMQVVFNLPGTFGQLKTILQDIPDFKDWVYATKSSVLVSRVSDNETIYYSEVTAPWPLSNRDFYGDTRIWIDSVNHELKISSQNIDQNYPVKPNLVRIPFLRAAWTVTQLSARLMHVIYTLSWNPGGNVPAWVANLFSTTGPLQSFTQLRKKMSLLPQ